ncbi:hypothetical protein FAUST_7434 [Fusarium austroamericanum]|uniref:Uncharacterized protein n=1 Tax=Fusarium austroamericanum TaxID=282268 RepID=A0AAN5Z7X6_FUSAU|nr:hypothetical protein FAUST_7434 [Fusarium austroamericanum]
MKTFSTQVMAVSALLAGLSQSFEMRRPPPVELVKGFDWADPFTLSSMAAFQPRCDDKKQFEVFEYTLAELMEPPPKGLKPWAKGLKAVFANREYPGGWLGLDPHAGGRSVLLMNYNRIPLVVREWIEQQERTDGEGKALFAVLEKPKNDEDEIEEVVKFPEADKIDRANDKDKVAVFAPGALYGILPLWAAEASECKDQLVDLSKYSPQPADGGVVAWVLHSERQSDQKTKIDIRVQALKGKKAMSGQEQGQAKTASREEL